MRDYQQKMAALGQTKGARVAADLEDMKRSFRVFTGNADELLTFLGSGTDDPSDALELMAVKNREGFERFLDEVDRLLHNFLAAVASLRDHTRRVHRAWLPPDPMDRLGEQYEARVKAVFDESSTARVIQGLRNFVTHTRLPRLLGYSSWAIDKPFRSKIVFDRSDLLQWDGWTKRARSFLEADDEPIALDELLGEYRDAVSGFHNWFGHAVAQRNIQALREPHRGRQELAEYARSLFGAVPAHDD